MWFFVVGRTQALSYCFRLHPAQKLSVSEPPKKGIFRPQRKFETEINAAGLIIFQDQLPFYNASNPFSKT